MRFCLAKDTRDVRQLLAKQSLGMWELALHASAISKPLGDKLRVEHAVAHFMLNNLHLHRKLGVADGTATAAGHFWFGAGKLHCDGGAAALNLGCHATVGTSLIGIGLVTVDVFLSHALLEIHWDFHSHHFGDGGVFITARLYVLRAGGEANTPRREGNERGLALYKVHHNPASKQYENMVKVLSVFLYQLYQ